MDISIVIPVYNKDSYLAACLDSVLGEPDGELEVICIDDASTDGSQEVLDRYRRRDARVRVIASPANLGPARSRNIGIDAARGDFIRFLDADDLLPGQSTSLLYQTAVRDQVEVAGGSLAQFRGTDSDTHVEQHLVSDKRRRKFRDLEELWVPWWHTSYLISMGLIRRHGLRYPDLSRGEDPAFLASVLVHANAISLVAEVVYLYRKYSKPDGSAGRHIDNILDHLEHAAMVKRLYTEYHLPCWSQGYGPFLLGKVQTLLARCSFTADQQADIEERMSRIWGTAL